MKIIQRSAAILLVIVLGITQQACSQITHKHGDHIMVIPDTIKWSEGPASLPAGAQKIIIEGDPKDSGLFTMRLKLPAGYKIMPHRHTSDEHVTVIEGSFYMGTGEQFDEQKMTALPTGGFAVMFTGTPHFGYAKQDCIIQIHAMGPWVVIYVNPGDDPRKNK